MRQLIIRLSNTGRVYHPPGHDEVESALLEWLLQGRHREHALEWLSLPPPRSVDDHGRPPLSWAKHEFELRRPSEAALGIDHESSQGGFEPVVHYWLPRPLRLLLGLPRPRRGLR